MKTRKEDSTDKKTSRTTSSGFNRFGYDRGPQETEHDDRFLGSSYNQRGEYQVDGVSFGSEERFHDSEFTLDPKKWGNFGKGPKGYKRSDERIREDVCERLLDSPEVDASEIEVTVNDGCIHLRGFVDSRATKRAAEYALEHVTGVTDIQNELRIKEGERTDLSLTPDKRFS